MICDNLAIFFLGIRKKNPCIYFKSIYILWKQPLKMYSINKISLKDMQVLWNTQKTHALTHKKYRVARWLSQPFWKPQEILLPETLLVQEDLSLQGLSPPQPLGPQNLMI